MDTEREKTKKTDEEFLSAYDRYADDIFRYLYFRLPDRDTARDLTQETFLRAWKSVAGGARFGNVRAFLYRVAKNLTVDFYRKKKDESLEDALGEKGDVPAASATADFLEAEAVRQLLDSLGEKHRDAITMRFLGELSIGEIAEATGVSETLVSVRIHRGLKKLKKSYEERNSKQI